MNEWGNSGDLSSRHLTMIHGIIISLLCAGNMQYTLTRITVHSGYYSSEEKPKFKQQLTL
jgi:hypothetical protein